MMSSTKTDIVSIEVDAHAFPFDGQDDNPSMVELAETFGILVQDITDTPECPAPGWCWWYRFTGPRANVRRAIDTYWGSGMGDEYMAPVEVVI